jgi:hypothetical protein
VTGIKTTYKGKIHTSNCTGLPWTAMVPKLLRCPLSGKIMQYPVIIATGQTFERVYIKEWFTLHGHVCPITQEPVYQLF